jgi:hypothetical protein
MCILTFWDLSGRKTRPWARRVPAFERQAWNIELSIFHLLRRAWAVLVSLNRLDVPRGHREFPCVSISKSTEHHSSSVVLQTIIVLNIGALSVDYSSASRPISVAKQAGRSHNNSTRCLLGGTYSHIHEPLLA